MDQLEADPDTPVETLRAKKMQEKKEKKLKPSRGGGGGFGK